MAPPEEDLQRRVARKLTKKNKHPLRMPSAHLPERLRRGEDDNEDVTAPSTAVHGAPQSMNQSIFSMVAAAGSRTDFNARFDESSDSEDDDKQERGRSRTEQDRVGSEVQSSGVGLAVNTNRGKLVDGDLENKRKLSEQRLLQSVSLLPHKIQKDKAVTLQKSRSPSTKGKVANDERMKPQDAPMMSRLLTAQAELDASDLTAETRSQSNEVKSPRLRRNSSPKTLLAVRLMEIFGFENPEKVVSEYPCWLLQSVLLQGYMYITQRHICFYAYLPKKSNVVAKTGSLSKRGRQNMKYHRYWFTLKGDVLSYYSNPSDLYFPHGNIDLRYGISAALAGDKEKQKETKDFTVITDHRSYHFRADSVASAKEWVKTLQKVIFRSHNDGDSVKISLPIENVIDIDESPVVEFAETFKIRVIESGDSYAIDEVCTVCQD